MGFSMILAHNRLSIHHVFHRKLLTIARYVYLTGSIQSSIFEGNALRCGNRNRTCFIKIMSLARYCTALPRRKEFPVEDHGIEPC